MKLVIEISTDNPDDTVAELWEAMQEDVENDPKHRLTLETRSFVADVKVVEVRG